VWLIKEQEADDSGKMAPQRHGMSRESGGVRVVPFDTLHAEEASKAHPLWAARGIESNDVKAIRAAIESAPEEQQEVFRLVYEEQLTQREAAERLGISQSAVRDRLARLQKRVAREVLA
jgi:DNA-directed RNA polymerase specialized sigma24 family protein